VGLVTTSFTPTAAVILSIVALASDTVWLGAGAATVVLSTGEGFDTINNFQLGNTSFQLGFGLSYSDLNFTDSANGAQISFGKDVLAVVSSTQASSFANNPGVFV
jgi:hypothetical protein